MKRFVLKTRSSALFKSFGIGFSSGWSNILNILSSNFNELPNNIFLDVSSINSVAYPVMSTNGGGTVNSMSLKEWWLE